MLYIYRVVVNPINVIVIYHLQVLVVDVKDTGKEIRLSRVRGVVHV